MQTKVPHILYVEDSDDHAELFLRSLEEGEFEVTVDRAADGEQALDYLYSKGAYEQGHRAVDMIILALRMPKLDGLEVLKEIKNSKEYHLIPVVVLTTSNAETDRLAAYEYRANAYVVKPIDYDTLVALTETLKLFWFEFSSPPPRDS